MVNPVEKDRIKIVIRQEHWIGHVTKTHIEVEDIVKKSPKKIAKKNIGAEPISEKKTRVTRGIHMLIKASMQPEHMILRQRMHEFTRARETPQNHSGCRRRADRRPGTWHHDLTRRRERKYAARREHARSERARREYGRKCAKRS